MEIPNIPTIKGANIISIDTEIQPSNIAGVYERGESDEVPYLSSKQVIQIPKQLNKIGNIKDRLYWDDNKGHYCIEQNILKVNFLTVYFNIYFKTKQGRQIVLPL